jgi:hypothetical protein
MAWEMARRGRVLVPALFGCWLLFLAWTLTGPFVLQVVAPGADPAVEASRYATWAYRMTFFLVATVTVTYVCTFRLTAERVARILGVMFMVVVAGGWLGVLAPHLSFPSLTELLLPAKLTRNPFIYDQVHPTPAELQNYLGLENARPSAPFSYANAWGLNYAVLLPFFVRAWTSGAGFRRRALGFTVLLLSVVPVIVSLDRGLWAALLVLALFVAIHGWLMGQTKLLVSVVAGITLVTVVILTTPLLATIEARFSGHDSTQGRTNLGTLAVVSTATRSPIVGFGSTRRVLGSFQSIAQGATPSCPLCTPPALGTQGILWTVIFAFGFLGGLFFICFFVMTFVRNLVRWRSQDDTMCLSVLLVFLVTMPIYDFSYSALVAVMSAVALLNNGRVVGGAAPLARYTTFMRHHWRTVLVLTLLGAFAGGVREYLSPNTYHATASYVVPLNRVEPGDVGRLLTLDEVAAFAQGEAVTSAVAHALGVSDADVIGSVSVTAIPNTRILHITYTARSAATARRGARAAVTSLLRLRRNELTAERQREVRSITAGVDQLAASLQEVKVLDALTDEATSTRSALEQSLEAESVQATADLVATQTAAIDPGVVLGSIRVARDSDGWAVGTSSGAALGLLGGVGAARWLSLRRRLGAASAGDRIGSARVMTTLDIRRGQDQAELDALRHLSHRHASQACLSLDGRPESRYVADLLDASCRSAAPAPTTRSTVIVVASTRSRASHSVSRLNAITGASIDVAGVVLVRAHPRRRST